MTKNRVEILLATHNGEKYLVEQIESILDQDYEKISLTIRDDASTDGTKEILGQYCNKYPTIIRVIYNENEPDGPIGNFSSLISVAEKDYIMLSDQDDYWMKNKVTRLMDKLKSLEKIHGSSYPLLAHSDLTVVDKNREIIHNSFWKYSGYDPKNDSFERLLAQNVITGSASIFNRTLADLCIPIPRDAMMHDWWIAIVASTLGEIGVLNESTTLYRQHGENVLGAREFSWKFSFLYNKVKNVVVPKRTTPIFENNYKQARAFKTAYYKKLTEYEQKQLDAFVGLESQNIITRRYYLLRYGFLLNKLIQNIGLIIRI